MTHLNLGLQMVTILLTAHFLGFNPPLTKKGLKLGEISFYHMLLSSKDGPAQSRSIQDGAESMQKVYPTVLQNNCRKERQENYYTSATYILFETNLAKFFLP